MTKKETAQAEEKQLVWKFKQLPTAGEVAQLVETKVITPEQAKAILFKEEVKRSDEVEALKAMVEALQEMVKDLLSRDNNITLVPYTKVVEVPAKRVPYWNQYWMTSGGTGVINTTSTTGYNGSAQYTLSVS